MFSLWRKARRENSAASRLLGTTSLRFALHGWQRLTNAETLLWFHLSISHAPDVAAVNQGSLGLNVGQLL
ncbi:hypothetical protein, partial [Thiolapillus sp.]|uniref:hypothetical protein n=1 Tax=Thiolapillus sp. TaxID=2017437 RepID=UPI003AF9A3A6